MMTKSRCVYETIKQTDKEYKMELNSLQQETGYKEWELRKKDDENILDFDVWYRFWCEEEGLFHNG